MRKKPSVKLKKTTNVLLTYSVVLLVNHLRISYYMGGAELFFGKRKHI